MYNYVLFPVFIDFSPPPPPPRHLCMMSSIDLCDNLVHTYGNAMKLKLFLLQILCWSAKIKAVLARQIPQHWTTLCTGNLRRAVGIPSNIKILVDVYFIKIVRVPIRIRYKVKRFFDVIAKCHWGNQYLLYPLHNFSKNSILKMTTPFL